MDNARTAEKMLTNSCKASKPLAFISHVWVGPSDATKSLCVRGSMKQGGALWTKAFCITSSIIAQCSADLS